MSNSRGQHVEGAIVMRTPHIALLAAGLVVLSACSQSPREEAAENVEANADAMAENIEDAAGNGAQ